MRITVRKLRAIIHHRLKEDLYTKGMYTSPTTSGIDREQLKDNTRSENPEDDVVHQSHLADVHCDCDCDSEEDCDCEDTLGPVPPGNSSVVDGLSIGQDPYVNDWNSINSRSVSR